MAVLPDVTLTIADGSLGLTPASADNTHIVLGACTAGTVNTFYSFTDTKTLVGTLTGGTAVEAAAHSLSVAGGPVLVVPINQSVAAVAPTLAQVGTGTGLVTAPSVSAVISGGTTPPAVTITGVPTAAAAGVIALTIPLGGAVGTATFSWTLNGVTQGTSVVTASTVALGATGLTANFAAGTYNTNNTYAFGVTVPNDGHETIVKIVTGGTLAQATFQVASDSSNPAGPSYGTVTAAPAAASPFYLVPGTGVTLTFTVAGTYVAGDTFAGKCTAPGFSSSDINAAMTAILADPREWSFVHLVGRATSATASAAIASVLDTNLTTASNSYRFAWALMECAPDTDANIISAFSSFASTRTCVVADVCELTSSVSGRVIARPAGWPVAARASLAPLSEDMGRVASGALPGVVKLGRDEQATPGLDAARVATLRTIIGRAGFYITNGQMMSPQGSDFRYIHLRRVMDKSCKVSRDNLMLFLNGTVRVNADGTIYELDARTIEQFVASQLNSQLTQKGFVSSLTVQVNRAGNILSTQTLPVKIRIVPLGYAKAITLDIGFNNPALTLVKASL